MSAERNHGGLTALIEALTAAHEFETARRHALDLVRLAPTDGYAHQLLGDVLLEIGDYDGATRAFESMRERDGETAFSEIRFAQLAALRGDLVEARRRSRRGLELSSEVEPPMPELTAWCQWQLGELAYSAGEYDEAERRHRAALALFPGTHEALVGLGEALAARGDLEGAIGEYERAARMDPEPATFAALGDLYRLAGRDEDAASAHARTEAAADLAGKHRALYSRQLARYWADHDLRPEDAYRIAAEDFRVRQDVHGADVLAWAALKAGRVEEAKTAIRRALRLGTKDATIFYHAGRIALVAGDRGAAREHLRLALATNPAFDPLQAPIARGLLAELGATPR